MTEPESQPLAHDAPRRTRAPQAVWTMAFAIATLILAIALFFAARMDRASDAPLVHYAPAEDLERLDVAALDRATRTIDLAAYVLTDAPVIAALDRAALRGVVVRILFDRGQLETRPESLPLIALQDVPGVTVRVKTTRVLMHLKAYAVDGRWLRVGSANFSGSGLRAQDNELIILDSTAAATRFATEFESMWAQGGKE